MAENVMNAGWETFWIVFGTSVCFLWLLASVLHYKLRHRTPSMPKTPRPVPREKELTHAPGTEPADKPEGYVMAFNKHVEEAEGGLTPLGWVVFIGVPLWWALYLIVYWGRDLTPLPTDLLPF